METNMTRNADKEPMVGAAEVTRRLGISPSGVYRAARRGTIPSARIGHSVRFDWSTVLAAVATPSPDAGVDADDQDARP